MRLHRNTKLVFAFGNMTVAIVIFRLFRLRRWSDKNDYVFRQNIPDLCC